MTAVLLGDGSWLAVAVNTAPDIGPGTFNITTSYTNGQHVGTVELINTPNPAATFSITAGNTNSTFAIDSSTGNITVADATQLIASDNYSLTITATNSAGSDQAVQQIVVAGSSTGQIATLVLRNDSGVTQPADSFAAEVGHYFKQGDVPAASHLEVRADDGSTKLTALIESRTYWEQDGSLMFAGIKPRINSQILNGASQTIKLFKSSTAHGTSGLDLTGLQALDIKAVGERVTSGTATTLTASLNTAIAAGLNTGYWIDDDSEGGYTLEAVAYYNDGAANSTTLACMFFITVLKDASGGVYGYLVDIAPINGFHGVSPSTTFFKSMQVKSGDTVLRTMTHVGVPVAFTRSPSLGLVSVSSVESGGSGYGSSSLLTVAGGTFSTVAKLRAPASGGVVTSAAIENNATTGISNSGQYTVAPSNPVSVTGGAGSGATFNLSFGNIYLAIDTTGLDASEGAQFIPVYLATTGVLPAGWAANTGYVLRVATSGLATLHATVNDALIAVNPIPATDDGSGVHTLNVGFALEFYDAGKSSRDANGDPIFIAGTGSVAPKCWAEYDNSYRIATKVFGPRDLSVLPLASTDHDFVLMRQGGGQADDDFVWREDNTGERLDIGYYTGWDAVELHRSDAASRKRSIRNALTYGSARSICYMRPETKQFVNLTGSVYTGLGTGIPGIRIRPTGPYFDGGATAPAVGSRTKLMKGGTYPSAHAIMTMVHAYELTGSRYLLHMALANSHRLAISQQLNIETVNGTPVGVSIFKNGDVQIRAIAWCLGAIVDAHRICPASYRGSELKAMYREMLDNSADWWPLKQATLTSFMQTNKFWYTGPNSVSAWQACYFLTGALRAYTQTGDVGWKTMCEDILEWLDNIRVNKGAGSGDYLSWYNCSVSVSWASLSAWSQITVNPSPDYEPHIYGCIHWAKALGFTIPSGMEAAIESVYTPGTWDKHQFVLTDSFGV